jgi:ECF sigma factor
VRQKARGAVAVALEEALVFAPDQSSELIKLDRSLDRLAKLDARKARIMMLRLLASLGLTVEEKAEPLGSD